MNDIKPIELLQDDIDRRGFLKCMAWAGSGVLFSIIGGVPLSFNLSHISQNPDMADEARNAVLADNLREKLHESPL